MPSNFIPTASPVPVTHAGWALSTGVPVDSNDQILIPELVNRSPTHNESVLLAGDEIHMASTNVESMWWRWGINETYEPRLFVRFLDGSLYVYHGAELGLAVGMIQTSSPGRYVWNVLRVRYPVPSAYGSGPGQYECLVKGTRKGKRRAQVVRLHP
jgi:hypothetical protein